MEGSCVAKRRLTGVGIGTPLASANLSWENVGTEDDLALRPEKRCLVLPSGKLPRVREVANPLLLGVHPSSPVPAPGYVQRGARMETVPEYVPRDIDAELQGRLADPGFVVLVGDSSAGKSRAAFEAIAGLPDHVLVVPQDRDAVAAAIAAAADTRHCVLWLDDLENFVGSGGLTRAGVARLITGKRSHRVIVATLRAAEEAMLASDAVGEDGGWRSRREAREVLELAHRIPLPRLFSSSEVDRARTRTSDPRIAEALQHADEYGVAEYLAAGPELLRDWQNAWSPNTDPRAASNPRAAALIAAAIDIRRGGYASPLPRQLLEQVHDYYLREHGGSRLRPEPLEDAWAWAMRARRATTALFQPVDEDHVQVFDYLLDVVQRNAKPGDIVPDPILESALAAAAPADADNIARTADRNGRYNLAEAASRSYSRALHDRLGPEHHDTLAARAFHADILGQLGRHAEFESEHRVISETAARIFGSEDPLALESRTGRAFALIRLGRYAEAEAELSAVQEVSSRVLGPRHDMVTTSRHLRAMALHSMGRLSEAEAENRHVLETCTAEHGPEDLSALYSRGNLAMVLNDLGKKEEAEAEAAAVLDMRSRMFGPAHPITLHMRAFRANVLRQLGRQAESASEHQAVIEIATRVYGSDDSRVLASRNGRAFALIKLGRYAEADVELRAVQDISLRIRGPENGITISARHIRAIALRGLGKLDEAEAENRLVLDASTRQHGPEHVNTLYSRGNLAQVLHDLGRNAEAEPHARATLEARTKALGTAHADVIHLQSLLASIEAELSRGDR